MLAPLFFVDSRKNIYKFYYFHISFFTKNCLKNKHQLISRKRQNMSIASLSHRFVLIKGFVFMRLDD